MYVYCFWFIYDAAICAEHVAWNGITTVNNESETVQQNLIYHLSIYLGGLSKTGLQAQISQIHEQDC